MHSITYCTNTQSPHTNDRFVAVNGRGLDRYVSAEFAPFRTNRPVVSPIDRLSEIGMPLVLSPAYSRIEGGRAA